MLISSFFRSDKWTFHWASTELSAPGLGLTLRWERRRHYPLLIWSFRRILWVRVLCTICPHTRSHWMQSSHCPKSTKSPSIESKSSRWVLRLVYGVDPQKPDSILFFSFLFTLSLLNVFLAYLQNYPKLLNRRKSRPLPNCISKLGVLPLC